MVTECLAGYNNVSGDIYRICLGSSWSGIDVVCQILDCGPVPESSQMYFSYNSTKYRSEVTYRCPSGYTRLSSVNRVVYTCNASGEWFSMDTDVLHCPLRYQTYHGCFSTSLFEATNTTRGNVFECVDDCKKLQKAFGGSVGLDCFCSDEAPSSQELNNSLCNMPCLVNQICGGDGVISVHVTYAGCYYLPEPFQLDFAADGKQEITCVESCRGMRRKFAIFSNSWCSCTDNIAIVTSYTPINTICAPTNSQNKTVNYAFIVTVGKTLPKSNDCQQLYDAGIRRHGEYILKNGLNITCHFKDGTVCPTSWIGNEGICYFFEPRLLSATDASKNCIERNAFLVSMITSNESNFIDNALDTFSSVDGSIQWLTGLFANGYFHPEYQDGSIPFYNKFSSELPLIDSMCTVLEKSYSGTYKWYLKTCDKNQNSICKQLSDGQYCMSMEEPTDTPKFTRSDMTITWCIQSCLGAGLNFSAVYYNTCYCVNKLVGTPLPWTDCDITCPGNSHQICGGTSNVNDIIRVFGTSVQNAQLAESCRELEFYGIKDGNFMLSKNGTTWIQYCNTSSCPDSWISVGQSCYNFLTANEGDETTCLQMTSHGVVINDNEELSTLRQIINEIRNLHETQNKWKIGLFDHSGNGYFRWSNGRFVEKKWRDVGSVNPGECLGFDRLDADGTISPVDCSYDGLICESGPEYIGSFIIPNRTAEIESYHDMSVTLCVEKCRTLNKSQAVISELDCWCESDLLQPSNRTDIEFCYVSTGQPCGNTDISSVYSVAHFPSVVTSCDDLFQQGILLSGEYIVNGTPTVCYFENQSLLSENDHVWLNKDGVDYRPVYDEATPSDYNAKCGEHGGVPASIKTVDQYYFLLNIIKVSKMSSYDQILVGISDQFERGQFNWADGSLLQGLPWILGEPSFTKSMYAAIDVNTGLLTNNLDADLTYPMFCMTDKGYVGCYVDYTSALANFSVLSGYSSMTITQCHQLCVNHSDYFLISIESCYCVFNVTFQQLLMSSNCSLTDVPCPGNKQQSCGGIGYLRAYLTDVFSYAKGCEELHANGVMYSSQYHLQNQNNTESNIVEYCGFSENSSNCQAGWIAHNSSCFWPVPRKDLTYLNAAKSCFSKNGYLLTVRNTEDIQFLWNLTNDTPPWSKITLWMTGIYNNMRNGRFLRSNGLYFLKENFSWNSPTIKSEYCTALDIASGNLTWIDCNAKLPFFCQRDDFYSCKYISREPLKSVSLGNSISIQQCIEICRPVNAVEVGLQNTDCHCYDTESSLVTDGVCDVSCLQFKMQACGGSTQDNLESVYKIDFYKANRASSCKELQSYGISHSGEYVLKLTDVDEFKTTCFEYGVHYNALLKKNGGTLTASSEMSNSKRPEKARLYDFMQFGAWTPASDDSNPWIKATFTEDYLITAIAVRGDVNHWCPLLTILYNDVIKGNYELFGEFSGNNDSMTVVTHYFKQPFVTNSIKILVKTSEQPVTNLGLRMEIYGESYSLFNHGNRFIGCFALIDETDYAYNESFIDEETCRSVCHNNSSPFYAIATSDFMSAGKCYCVNSLGNHGMLNESNCVGYNYPYSMAVYRTYVKECQVIPDVGNSTNVLIHGYSHETVNGFGSFVTYNCLPGYEFDDFETNKNVYCTNNNTWTIDFGSCQLKECPSPTAMVNSVIQGDQYFYNNTVKYLCSQGYKYTSGASFYTVLCLENKQWSSVPPSCEKIQCSTPPQVESALTMPLQNKYYYNDMVTYTCILNSVLPDNRTETIIQCSENGTWSSIPEPCTLFACSMPPIINGSTQINVHEKLIVYVCLNNHYFADGTIEKNVTCGADFKWLLINDSCKISVYLEKYFCQIRNGIRRITTNMIEVPTRSNIDCALKCASNVHCLSFNFHDKLQISCELLMDPPGVIDDERDSDWYGYNRVDKLPC